MWVAAFMRIGVYGMWILAIAGVLLEGRRVPHRIRHGLRRTRVQCDGGQCCSSLFINRSCVYSNLYYSERRFRVMLDRGRNRGDYVFDRYAVASGLRPHAIHPFFFPELGVWDPNVSYHGGYEWREGTFLVFSGGPHGNWAHAMLDNLYSIWLAACKFGLDLAMEMSFTGIVLDTIPTPQENPIIEQFRTFLGGLEFEREWPAGAAYKFQRVVAGTGQMGLGTPGTDYVLPGRKFNALQKMRDRFYYRYGLALPRATVSSLELRSARQERLHVMFVPNRRDYGGILDIDGSKMHDLVWARPWYAYRYLDWGLPFHDRLHVIREADIAVTGVGTGACNLFLLSDGAVIVNLGTSERTGFMGFQEEFLFAAMYWVRMVYPTYEQYARMSQDTAMELIDAGRDLILSDFDTTQAVDGRVNFSPVGRAASEYLQEDLRTWSAFVGNFVQDPVAGYDDQCLNFFEKIICRTGPWASERCSRVNASRIEGFMQLYGIRCSTTR